MSSTPRLLDLRGMRCPWPAIRVARAIREAHDGADLLVTADDPAAPREIEAVAIAHGWRFAQESSGVGSVIRLRSR